MNSTLTRLVTSTLCLALTLSSGIAAARHSGDTGVPAIESVARIVTGASRVDAFRRPSGLNVGGDRNVFVVMDRGNYRLVLFDRNGRCRGSISYAGRQGRGRFGEPTAVAVDHEGRFYVADALNDRVQVMTSRGSLLATLKLPGVDGADVWPQSLVVGKSGLIYVLFEGDDAGIMVFEPGGTLRDDVGIPFGTESLVSAASMAMNEAETEIVVVTPLGQHQVTVYSVEGRLLSAFGRHGEGDDTFSLASHVTWGPGNTLWITDTLRHSISVFTSRGKPLGRIGGFGRNPGQFLFPVACGFLDDDHLVVLERGSQRCQILKVQTTLLPGDEVSSNPEGSTMNLESINSSH